MTINIKYTAQLKKTAGTGREIVEVPDNVNLTELLKILSEGHDDNFYKMLFTKEGKFSNSVVPVLNGRQIRVEEKIIFKNNDELLLLSPIAGG